MFLILAPGYAESLVRLQLEFERSLMGVPPWTPAALIRLAAGWELDRGERVQVEALSFRGELWCTKDSLLVHDVWKHAQVLPGKTFASQSRLLLEKLDMPEIFAFPGWAEFVDERQPVLPSYKLHLRRQLERQSAIVWLRSLRSLDVVSPHILSQKHPVSVGGRLLDLGRLDLLRAAADFDLLRIGALRLSLAVPGGAQRRCMLCGALGGGVAHALATCVAGVAAREVFLVTVDRSLSDQLRAALEGDWPVVLLSPHQGFDRLVAAVLFAAELVHALRPMQ